MIRWKKKRHNKICGNDKAWLDTKMKQKGERDSRSSTRNCVNKPQVHVNTIFTPHKSINPFDLQIIYLTTSAALVIWNRVHWERLCHWQTMQVPVSTQKTNSFTTVLLCHMSYAIHVEMDRIICKIFNVKNIKNASIILRFGLVEIFN